MSIETGLEVGIDASKAKQGASEFNAAMDSMGVAAETNLGRVRSAVGGITSSIFSFRNVLLGIGLTSLIRDLIQTQLWFNQTNISLQASTGSAAAAAYEYNFLTKTVQRLGLDLKSAGTQFAFLEAAARNTGFQGAEAEHVFVGFSTAIAGLHLPAERAALILGAVQRMISTNVVNARELRLQLGFSLPGAMQIAAEATGKTQQQLNELMRAGKLYAKDVLPGMADALIRIYGKAAEQAANSTQGLINRFNSAKTQFQLNILKGGLGVSIDSSLKEMVEAMEDPKFQEAAFTIGHVLGDAVRLAASAFEFMTQHVWLTIGAFGALIGLQVFETILRIAEAVKTLKEEIVALNVVEKLSTIFSGSLAGATAAGVGAGPLGGSVLQASAGESAKYVEEAAAANTATAAIKDLGAAKGKLAYFQRSAILTSQEAKTAMEAELPLFASLAPSVATNAKQMELFAVEQTASKAAVTETATALTAETAVSGGAVEGLMAAASAVPVWGWILAAVAALTVALYKNREATFAIGQETFKVKDLWNAWVGGMKENIQDIVDGWKMGLANIEQFWQNFFDSVGLTEFVARVKKAIDDIKAWASEKLANLIPESMMELLRRYKSQDTKPVTSQIGTPPPNGKFGVDEPGKAQVDRVQELLDKQKVQIDTMKQLITLNQQYAFSQEQGDIAIAKATALRKADEEIIRLHGKATAEQVKQIRDNEVAVAMLEIRERSLVNFRKANIDVTQEILDQKQLNLAHLEGAAAIDRVTMAVEVQNKVRALGIGLTAQEKAAAADRFAEQAAEKLRGEYIGQAEALKSQLNPLYAREQAEEHLNQLMKVGVLTQDEATRARKEYDRTFDESINSQLEKSQQWQDGVLLGMRRIQMESQDVAKNVAAAFTDAFTQIEDAMTNFLDTGKLDFKSLEKSILHTINGAVVKNVMGGLMGKILGNEGTGNPDSGGSLFGQIFGISGLFGKGRQTPTGTSDNPFYVRMSSQGGAFTGALTPDGESTDIIGQIMDMQQASVDNQNQIWSEEIPSVGNVWKEQGQQVGSFWEKIFGSANGGSGGGGFMSLLFGSQKGDGGGLFGSLFGAGGGSDAATGGGADFGVGDPGSLAFATGGIMTSHGRLALNRYSAGGVARSAQMAMFGEGSQPEAFVPLPDGRNIPVKMEGGGKTIYIEQHLHITGVKDVDSFRRSQTQIMHSMAMGTQRAQERNG